MLFHLFTSYLVHFPIALQAIVQIWFHGTSSKSRFLNLLFQITILKNWDFRSGTIIGEKDQDEKNASQIYFKTRRSIMLKLHNLFICILFVYSITSISFAANNLVENPGFEEGDASSWENMTAGNITSSEAHSGTYSCKITKEIEAKQTWFNVDTNKTYVALVWFKWYEFLEKDWGHDRFRVFDNSWQTIESINHLHAKYTKGIWNKIAITFSPTTPKVGISFGVFGPVDNAELYFDDVSLIEKTGNEIPTLNPQADFSSGTIPFTVNFTANADDADGAIKYFYWEFGDGSRDIMDNPTHTYYEKGVFSAELTVYDNDGTSASSNVIITVTDSQAPGISIQNPTTANTYNTTADNISLQGLATASGSISDLVWDNIHTFEADTFQVPANQSTKWDTGNIPLRFGKNEILLTATDNNGRVQTTKIVVWRELDSPAIKDVDIETTSVPLYSKYEATFQIDTIAENTFFEFNATPPEGVVPNIGITVQGIFVSPSGKTYIQPAFFFTQTEKLSSYYIHTTNNSWKIRFAPDEIGTWNASIKVQDAAGTVNRSLGTFTVTTSENSGFIKVSKRDWRYFEFSNGDHFWPLDPIYENYETNFNCGLNFTRPWMGMQGAYSANWARWISTGQRRTFRLLLSLSFMGNFTGNLLPGRLQIMAGNMGG